MPSRGEGRTTGSAIFRRGLAICAFGAFLFSGSALAATAFEFFASQQNPDGSFGNSSASLATPVQTTAEVLWAYEILEAQSEPLFLPALGYINSDAEQNTEFLARKIIVGVSAGVDVSVFIAALVANQNVDGSFGDQPGYNGSALDTAYALQALGLVGYNAGAVIPAGVGYLLARQDPSGGWSDGANDPSVFTTTDAVRALVRYRTVYQGVESALTNAGSYLLSKRTTGGLWSEPFETALALLALDPIADRSQLTSSFTSLAALQQANGSWVNDSYTTALALQALALLNAPVPDPTLGTIQGRVVDGLTGVALIGVAANLTGAANHSVTSDGSGFFRFVNLPFGSYSLTLSLSSYATVTTQTQINAGQVVDFGTIALTKSTAATTGTVRGIVTDAQTGQPLIGVAIVVTGTTPVVTDASGAYQIANVPPGAISLTANKVGYAGASGSATVTAGSIVIFSPALSAQAGDVTLQGRIVEAATGAPLSGVTVNLSGPTAGTLITGVDGRFIFTGIPGGSYTLTATTSGFFGLTASVAVNPGQYDLGDLGLSTDEPATTGILRGTVTDAQTGTPIAGASVSAGGSNTTADAAGVYLFAGLQPGAVVIQVSSANYVGASAAGTIVAGGTTIFSPALTPLSAQETALAGTVRDGVTNAPLAGVAITVSGESSGAAITNAQGSYRISGLSAGIIIATASLNGYDTATGTGTIAAGTTTNFSPRLYPTGNTPPDANATGVRGVVLDASTNQPIVATVTATSGALQQTTTTDSIGRFQLTGFDGTSITLTASAPDYISATLTLTLEPLKVIDVGQIRLRRNNTNTLLPDLIVTTVDASQVQSHPQTLALSGSIIATIENRGAATANGFISITVFEDIDRNGVFDISDPILGSAAINGLAFQQQQAIAIPVTGSLSFRDAPISVWVDSVQTVAEENEANNVTVSSAACQTQLPIQTNGGGGIIDNVTLQGAGISETENFESYGFVFAGQQTQVGDWHSGPGNTIEILDQNRYLQDGSTNKALEVEGNLGGTSVYRDYATVNGQSYILSVDYSPRASNPFDSVIQVYWEGELIGTLNTTTLGFRTYSFNVIATGVIGTSRLEFRAFDSVVSAAPDLTASLLRITGTTLSTRIGNAGAADSPATLVRFYEGDPAGGGRVLGDVNLTSLVGGSYTDVTLSNVSISGNIMLYAVVDPNNQISECREDNNTISIPGPALLPDLVVGSIDTSLATTDPQNLAVTGTLGVSLKNQGTLTVPSGVKVLAFYDVNRDGDYQADTDTALGTSVTSIGLPPGSDITIDLAIAGQAPFRDAPITVFVDSAKVIVESNETNNVAVASGQCQIEPGSATADLSASLLRIKDLGTAQGIELSLRVGSVISSPTFSPISWWPGEGNANDVADGNQGTTQGGVTFAPGKVGTAFGFDGIDDGVNVLKTNNLNMGPNDFSIEAWVKIDQAKPGFIFLNYAGVPYYGLHVSSEAKAGITFRPGVALFRMPNEPVPPEATATGTTALDDGLWHHLVGVRSGVTALIYVDGVLEGAVSNPDVLSVLGGSVNTGGCSYARIGATHTGPGHCISPTANPAEGQFQGLIDEVKIYNRALSYADVRAIYGGNVTSTEVTFYDGDPTAGGIALGTTTVNDLPASGYKDIVFTTTNLPDGTRDIYAVVDSANQIAECREDNNATHTAVQTNVRGAIAVATDKAFYGPNSPALLQGLVTNTGALRASFSAELRVEDTNGALVQNFPVQTFADLNGGASITASNVWNTGTTLTGTYRLHGLLRDAQGALIADAVATFEIRSSETNEPAVTLRAATDRTSYNVNDLVDIDSLVSNVTANALIDGAELRLRIKNSAGTTLFTNSGALGQLPPGALRTILLPYGLNNAPLGLYRIEGEVVNIATGTVLAASSTQYTVINDATKNLTGAVAVASPTVEIGASQICTYTVTNIGPLALGDIPLRMTVASIAAGTAAETFTQSVSLAPGASQAIVRTVGTSALVPGDYGCALEALVDGSYHSLGFATFRAVEPPIRIDAAISIGTKGRLLVLLDSANQCENGNPNNCPQDGDPHGPDAAPALSAQRPFLENLLTQAGWSYTITDNANAFTHELGTGGYVAYLLLSEQVKLSEPAQKELREAIFRGEGLVVAGSHDNRNHRLNDALGIKRIGTISQADNVTIPVGVLGVDGSLNPITGDRINRIKRLSAASLGVFDLGSATGDPCQDEEPGAPEGDACAGNPAAYLDAITFNNYGTGRVLFAGFDLLATATQYGPESLAARTLLAALALTHPTPLVSTLGGVLPIDLKLTNQGVATPIGVTVSVPPAVQVTDAGGGQLDNTQAGQTITWTRSLAVGEELTLRFFIRLPMSAATVSLHATVTAGQGANTRLAAETDLALTVNPIASLDDLAASANALRTQFPAHDNALKAAAANIGKAIKANSLDKALDFALKATDDLLGITEPEIGELRRGIDAWLRDTLMLLN